MADTAQLDRLSVVLVSTRNPLNIGAAARAMSNFGFSSLRVVNPYEPSFREARSAVGAASLLASAEEHKTAAAAVADCSLVVGTTAMRNRELQHIFYSLEEAAGLIREHLNRGRVGVLFGSEKTGLSNQDLSHCHWLLHIPTREDHVSMNLGQAVAIVLYEVARHCRTNLRQSQPAPGISELATAGDLERISAVLLEALQASGYIKSRAEETSEAKLRMMLRRMQIPAHDADVWLGMLRQILWKLKH